MTEQLVLSPKKTLARRKSVESSFNISLTRQGRGHFVGIVTAMELLNLAELYRLPKPEGPAVLTVPESLRAHYSTEYQQVWGTFEGALVYPELNPFMEFYSLRFGDVLSLWLGGKADPSTVDIRARMPHGLSAISSTRPDPTNFCMDLAKLYEQRMEAPNNWPPPVPEPVARALRTRPETGVERLIPP